MERNFIKFTQMQHEIIGINLAHCFCELKNVPRYDEHPVIDATLWRHLKAVALRTQVGDDITTTTNEPTCHGNEGVDRGDVCTSMPLYRPMRLARRPQPLETYPGSLERSGDTQIKRYHQSTILQCATDSNKKTASRMSDVAASTAAAAEDTIVTVRDEVPGYNSVASEILVQHSLKSPRDDKNSLGAPYSCVALPLKASDSAPSPAND